MNKLLTLLAIHEVGQALSPSVFEFNKDFNELNIILKLGIYYFYVLFIFLEKSSEVSKSFLYALGQGANFF